MKRSHDKVERASKLTWQKIPEEPTTSDSASKDKPPKSSQIETPTGSKTSKKGTSSASSSKVTSDQLVSALAAATGSGILKSKTKDSAPLVNPLGQDSEALDVLTSEYI